MPEIRGGSGKYRAFLEHRSQRLYKIAFALCHDVHLASDLAQETLTRAITQKGHFPDKRALDVWLCKVLMNCYRDHIRRQRPSVSFEDELYTPTERANSEYETHEIVERIHAAVATLMPAQREVVMLVSLEGFSYREVSEILDLPIGTVMSRLWRAREILRDELQDFQAPVNKVKWVQ